MIYFIYFVIIISFIDNFAQFPIISPFAEEIGGTSFMIGLTVGMYSFSNMVGNLVAGRWIDQIGRKKVMVVGMLIAAVSVLLYAFVYMPSQLVLVRFLHGIGGGLMVPAVFALLSDFKKEQTSGKAMSLSGAAIGIAAILGPAFSGTLSEIYGRSFVFTSLFILLLITAILVGLFLPESNMNGKMKKKSFLLPKKRIIQLRQSYIGAFALMFSIGILTLMLPLKVKALGLGAASTGMLMSSYGVAAIILFLLPVSSWLKTIGKTTTMVAGMSIMAVALVLLSAFQSFGLLLVAMVLFGFGFALLFPAMTSLIIDKTEVEERGRAFGIFYAFFSLGVVIGPIVIGLLGVSPNQGFIVASFILLLLSVTIGRRRKVIAQ
ncbi:MFS transporter [Bacillus alkalicellulosilyticus]|uniref:MFS transporter n=1 Tax=Alkalihalobacterium alkalicellulosilyticum TaxID=1912214 RepID=UPI000996536B|nr:MFS transporter [Bacillus alkalicellulosilyticus]